MVKPRFGVLIPHFGPYADGKLIIDGARLLESRGFDGIWVRDHVVYHPHVHEDPDDTYIDPFVVLTAAATVTSNLSLGFSTLIPHRHPINSAVLLSSLDRMAGPNRLIAAWGIGSTQTEFDAIGLGKVDRRQLVREHIDIIRQLWTGEHVSFEGDFYTFDDVTVAPRPPSGSVPMWYGGPSRAAVRRAVEYCNGWIPPRMPRRDYTKRVARMRQLAEDAGKPIPQSGIVATVVPGETVESAWKMVNVKNVAAEMARMGYETPPTGEFRTIEDFDGALIAGPGEVIADEIQRYINLGATEIVFDLRLRLSDWAECVGMLADEVIPRLVRKM